MRQRKRRCSAVDPFAYAIKTSAPTLKPAFAVQLVHLLPSRLMADADLYQLEFLSLINKITQELDNHVGVNDKTVAEFIVALHEGSGKSLANFKSKLQKKGLSPPDSFVETVDRLILTLHPKYKKRQVTKSAKAQGKAKANDDEVSEIELKRRMFPGLAVKDKEVSPVVSDDAFLQELGDLVAGKKRPASPNMDVSPKRRRPDLSPPRRGRSPSPRRGDGRDDRYGGGKDVNYGDGRNGRYGDGRGDRTGYRNGGRRQLDERPVLFKIYDGKVSSLKEFGAFVTLEGVAGRVEGTTFFVLRLSLILIIS